MAFSPDFWEKFVLQVVGPVVTAVVGTLIIGSFVNWITRRVQERRADSKLEEERLHAQNQLRRDLIDAMTETASRIYMATQQFWRKKNVERVSIEELGNYRKELDEQYQESRVMGEVIERRLEAYFVPADPVRLWHGTMDLLTVRYFHIIELATDNLLERNAGPEHTGLSVEQLRDQALVLKTYREKLKMAAQAVLVAPVRPNH